MTRRTRLCRKNRKTVSVRATLSTGKSGQKVRVVGPELGSDRADSWNTFHESFLNQVGIWQDTLDEWVAIYFHDFQTGELFLPEWLIFEPE